MIELTQMQTGRLVAAVAHLTLSEYNGTSAMTVIVERGITVDDLKRGVLATDFTKPTPHTHISVSIDNIEDTGRDISITFRLVH